MIDSTGKPVYVPDCGDRLTRAVNTFIFEGTIEVLKALSMNVFHEPHNKLTVTSKTGREITISIKVEESL